MEKVKGMLLKFLILIMMSLFGDIKEAAIAFYYAVEDAAKDNPLAWWQKRRLFLELLRKEFSDNDRAYDWIFALLLETIHSLITSGKWADKQINQSLYDIAKQNLSALLGGDFLTELFKTK